MTSQPADVDFDNEDFLEEQRRIYELIQLRNAHNSTPLTPPPLQKNTTFHRLLDRVDYCPYSFQCAICFDDVDPSEFALKMAQHHGVYWNDSRDAFIDECPGILLQCLHSFCTLCLSDYAYNYTLHNLGQSRTLHETETTSTLPAVHDNNVDSCDTDGGCIEGVSSSSPAATTTTTTTTTTATSSSSPITLSPYTIPCPHPACPSSLSESELRILLGDKYPIYEKKQLMLSLNPSHFHHCITPNCEYVVYWNGEDDNDLSNPNASFGATTTTSTTMRAPNGAPLLFVDVPKRSASRFDCPQCNKSMCLKCKSPWHTSLTCDEFQKEKNEENYGPRSPQHRNKPNTVNTPSHTNTSEELNNATNVDYSKLRECPRCGVQIEKVEGCDKMRCLCGYGFCFYCLTKDATCDCTPSNHVFYDNTQHRPEFGNRRKPPFSTRSNMPYQKKDGYNGQHPPECSIM